MCGMCVYVRACIVCARLCVYVSACEFMCLRVVKNVRVCTCVRVFAGAVGVLITSCNMPRTVVKMSRRD